MFALRFNFILLVLTWCSCGPLPRVAVKNPLLARLSTSRSLTGVVLLSADSQYASTAVYWYDFSLGSVSSLSGTESGDLLAKWDGTRLWLFNRSSGRLSYSSISPKSGTSSRSTEFTSLSKVSGDPSDVAWTSDGIAILANGSAGRVDFANLARGSLTQDGLNAVSTGNENVPFRPGTIAEAGTDVAIFHQQLDAAWTARGGGAVFIARKNALGAYAFVDQDAASAGTQGITLNVTNPVSVFACGKDSDTCYVAGACYESFGASCVGGVDMVRWSDHSIAPVIRWSTGTYSAGGTTWGPESGTALSCVISQGTQDASLWKIDLLAGTVLNTASTGAKTCGSFVADADTKRVYMALGNSFVEFDENLAVISRQTLPWSVSALEAVNE